MTLATLSGLGTLVLLLAFLGLCAWAYSPRQTRRWDDAAQLPFLDDETPRAARRDAGRRQAGRRDD
jgi:cytochrome c oxidase cbb3-type subunit 4